MCTYVPMWDENDENFVKLTVRERKFDFYLTKMCLAIALLCVVMCASYLGSFCCILDGRRIVTSENVHLENGFYPLSITLHTYAPKFESSHSMEKQRISTASVSVLTDNGGIPFFGISGSYQQFSLNTHAARRRTNVLDDGQYIFPLFTNSIYTVHI